LPLLARAKSVTVVVVDDDHPGPSGAAVAAYLGCHNIPAHLRQIENPATGAGQALLTFAAEQNVDWLVMGAYTARAACASSCSVVSPVTSSAMPPASVHGALIQRSDVRERRTEK
jgi:hypothetical protein